MPLITSASRRARATRLAVAVVLATTVGVGVGTAPASAAVDFPTKRHVTLQTIWNPAREQVHSVRVFFGDGARCFDLTRTHRGLPSVSFDTDTQGNGPAMTRLQVRGYSRDGCRSDAWLPGSRGDLWIYGDSTWWVSADRGPSPAR